MWRCFPCRPSPQHGVFPGALALDQNPKECENLWQDSQSEFFEAGQNMSVSTLHFITAASSLGRKSAENGVFFPP